MLGLKLNHVSWSWPSSLEQDRGNRQSLQETVLVYFLNTIYSVELHFEGDICWGQNMILFHRLRRYPYRDMLFISTGARGFVEKEGGLCYRCHELKHTNEKSRVNCNCNVFIAIEHTVFNVQQGNISCKPTYLRPLCVVLTRQHSGVKDRSIKTEIHNSIVVYKGPNLRSMLWFTDWRKKVN